LDPNNAGAYAFAGFHKLFLGRAEDGFAGVETALRLSPRDPNVPWWQFFMCLLHMHLAHWEQAIEWCSKSAAGLPEVFYPLVGLTAANAWAGHDREAKHPAAQLQKVYPGFTVQTWLGLHPSGDPTFMARFQRITEGLRKGGVPEGEAKKGVIRRRRRRTGKRLTSPPPGLNARLLQPFARSFFNVEL
jgi:adenylate cyclase